MGVALAQHHVEVLNLGVSGYGTADELVLLRAYGAELEPDLVLLCFSLLNDVRNNLQSPLCRRDATGVTCDDPVRPSRLRLASAQLRARLASRSQLYQGLRLVTSGPLFVRLGLRQAAAPDGTPEMPFGPDLFRTAEPAYLTEGLALTRELLRQTIEWNRSLGAETWLVLIPTRAQVADAAWERFTADLTDVERDRPQRALAAVGRELGVETIDLLAAFRARAAATGDPLYFRVDAHMNPMGHQVASEELVARLVERTPWRGNEVGARVAD
jgi:hypothetical protein